VFSEPDDFASRFGVTGRIVDAVRQLAQPVGEAAHRVAEQLQIGGAHVDETLDPLRAQFFGGHRADAPERVDRELLKKRLDAIGTDDGEPVGLLPAGRDLGEELVGGDPGRRGQSDVRADPLLESPCDRRRERLTPRVLGHVEVRLVERQRLDERRHLAENREHRIGRRLVAGEVGTDDEEGGAEAHGAGHRHRRVDAEGARLVAGRGDHAPPLGPSAHGERLAAQRGIVALLDRGIERVHVDVNDPSDHENSDLRIQI